MTAIAELHKPRMVAIEVATGRKRSWCPTCKEDCETLGLIRKVVTP